MNKRSTPIILVSCILALAGIAGYMSPPPTEANPIRVLMQNAGGRVVFTHQAHSTPGGNYGDLSCDTCHHELKIGKAAASGAKDGKPVTGEGAAASASGASTPRVTPCKSCHSATDNPGYVAAHQKLYQAGGDAACASCHHSRMAGLAGGWNHQQHIDEYAGGDCESCHHPLSYKTPSGRQMNIKQQKCRNCHTAKPNPMTATTLKDAAHARCQNCHSDLFEAKTKGCPTCHVQVSLADEAAKGKPVGAFTACGSCHAPMPGNMDAYHAQCRTCHDKVGKGPGAKAPCAQCHTP